MDSGCAAVLGALIGGLASLAGTMLAEYLKSAPDRELATIREDTLRKRFNASTKDWVPIERLMSCIGGDRETTVKHLLKIGARKSMGSKDTWGMKDWPEPKD